jgi:chromosome partitioning protein
MQHAISETSLQIGFFGLKSKKYLKHVFGSFRGNFMSIAPKKLWTISDVERLFRMKNKQALFKAEEKGVIPKAERTQRGKTSVRQWRIEQLPQIGSKYGFLKQPRNQKIICVYTAKGGVLKTTLSYNLARILALNGIKTLIVGLDIQCSITEIVIPLEESEFLEEDDSQQPGSLYQYLVEKRSLKEIIKNTDIPTLDIIPESPDLNMLEKKMRILNRREYLFRDKLISKLSQYKVILFDNGPSWNQLIESALTASNVVLSPVGCDVGTYQAIKTNLEALNEFKDSMDLKWKQFLLIPTLL